MRTRLMRIFVAAVALALPGFGQTVGEITGLVTDASGGVVVGATVTVTNPQTNFRRMATTNEAGNYSFPALQPGVYNVRVEASGFRTEVRTSVELQVQQAARIDFQLNVGSVAETVEVTGGAPLLNSENASLGTVIDGQRIVDLPLNGRNFLALVSESPNVSAGFNTNGGTSTGAASTRLGGDRANQSFSVSGSRREYNNYSIDGVTNTEPNYNAYLFLPSIDAIQEFKVQTGIYSAEFGRGIGQVNVSTKSGTNEYHGTVFEFLRNSALDARPFGFTKVVPQKSPFKQNQFGFTVGGPLSIPKVYNGSNRLFFMSNYEGFRARGKIMVIGLDEPIPEAAVAHHRYGRVEAHRNGSPVNVAGADAHQHRMRVADRVGGRVGVVGHLPVRRRVVLVTIRRHQLVAEARVDGQAGAHLPGVGDEISLVRGALLRDILAGRFP